MTDTLIVCKEGRCYIRRLACTVHDGTNNEMVYHCDKHLGGPYPDYETAVRALPGVLKLEEAESEAVVMKTVDQTQVPHR